MSRDDPQFKLRMPQALRNQLDELAKENKRSLNAEIVTRLEETLEIEAVLETVAPGAPITGTAGLLYELDKQITEQNSNQQSLAISAVSEDITKALGRLENLPLLTAALALQVAFPEAMNRPQKDRLLKTIASMIGSNSRDPSDLMQALSLHLNGRTLFEEIGL